MTLGEFRRATAKLPDKTPMLLNGITVAYPLLKVRAEKVREHGGGGEAYALDRTGSISAVVLD